MASLAKLVTHQERMQEDTLLPRILSAAFVLRTLQVILSSVGAPWAVHTTKVQTARTAYMPGYMAFTSALCFRLEITLAVEVWGFGERRRP